jgi:DNA-binding NarL/FixJ family response regulator
MTAQIERPLWRYRTKAQRDKRDTAILELWAMGLDRREIARRFDLTPDRISQIVLSYGGGFR